MMAGFRVVTGSVRVALPVVVLAVGLAGCATTQRVGPLTADQKADPYEASNRKILRFNQGFYRNGLRPFLSVYRALLPQFVRSRINSVMNLVSQPFTFGNEILQGKPDRAVGTLGRTLMNATVGVGGLFDPATEAGLADHDEDFGQTLAVWGLEPGPYLIVPFLGPSNMRDFTGLGVNIAADPVSMALSKTGHKTISYAVTGTTVLTKFDQNYDALTSLEDSSVDFYAALRSAYNQRRASQIRDGAPDPNAVEDDPLDMELDAPSDTAAESAPAPVAADDAGGTPTPDVPVTTSPEPAAPESAAPESATPAPPQP